MKTGRLQSQMSVRFHQPFDMNLITLDLLCLRVNHLVVSFYRLGSSERREAGVAD